MSVFPVRRIPSSSFPVHKSSYFILFFICDRINDISDKNILSLKISVGEHRRMVVKCYWEVASEIVGEKVVSI